MILLAVDPGSTRSAWLTMDEWRRPLAFGIENNEALVLTFTEWPVAADHMAIETMHSRGMPTAQEEFETQFWAGRFAQAFRGPFTQIKRHDVKMAICGSPRAKDSNIRQALIDQFGGKAMAVGSKKVPGDLYGIANDCWSALAIACYWWDTTGKETANAR
jgi:hypothetical protein